MIQKKRKNKLSSYLRLSLIAVGALAVLTAVLLGSAPHSVSAGPGDLSSIVAKYPILSGSMLQQCALCHTANIPSLNPFGAAYKSAGRNTSAFAAIENMDSDGDGATNLQEINSLTFPGDPASHPTLPTATATSIPPIPPTATPISPTATGVPPGQTPIAPTATSIPPTGQVSVTLACPASVLVGTTFTCNLSVNPGGASLAGLQVNLSGLNGVAGYTGAQFSALAGPSPISLPNLASIFTWAGSNGYLLNQSGVLASLSFKALGVGTAMISGQTKAANSANAPVNASINSAAVNIVTATGTQNSKISGSANLSSGISPTRASAALLDATGQVIISEPLETNGAYELEAPVGTYTLRISAPGYLAARKSVTLAANTPVLVASVTLLAGDINGDNDIDALDLISLGAAFEVPPPLFAADLNADGRVDLFDLTLLAPNWRKTGYAGW
jgi:hypothetical protein